MRPKITHNGGSSLKASLRAINDEPHKAIANTKQPMT